MSSLAAALDNVRNVISSTLQAQSQQSARTADSEDKEQTQAASSPRTPPPPADASPIQVYCRVRPPRNAKEGLPSGLQCNPLDKQVEFHLKQDGNQKSDYQFHFTDVFEPNANQETIFKYVGVPVVDNVLAGYNSTVFAYGQTGSGKTYTMMGGSEQYDQRGLIPRCLSYIFDYMEKHADLSIVMRISYLEIYNDKGYDLLSPEHQFKSLEDLPKVYMLEDENGAVHFKNLHELPATTVDEALNLLFVGDTNRVVCETPSNDASTRSHCIFTITLELRQSGGLKVRRSKLNLVDLAGSERVKKTNIQGSGFKEALYINKSLHFLEQVIVALHDQANGKGTFVPYRNSMLTNVLRDSLGGNCKTIMIATISAESKHLDESISTSRFAQRVAQIKNYAEINESVDPFVMIKKLKVTIRDLKQELAAQRGENIHAQPLEDEEKAQCRRLIDEFISQSRSADEKEDDKQISMVNPYKVRYCFDVWKEKLVAAGQGQPVSNSPTNDASLSQFQQSIQSLQYEYDYILLSMKSLISKEQIQVLVDQAKAYRAQKMKTAAHSNSSASSIASPRTNSTSSAPLPLSPARPRTPALTPEQEAAQRRKQAALEQFKKSYKKNQVVEEQRANYAHRVNAARELGEAINQCRADINQWKMKIEQRRIQRGVQAIGNPSQSPDDIDAEEQEYLMNIEHQKQKYKDKFEQLKALKTEIEYLKVLIERSRAQLMSDFDHWWKQQAETDSNNTSGISSSPAAVLSPRSSHIRPSSTSSPSSRSAGSNLISAAAAIARQENNVNTSQQAYRSAKDKVDTRSSSAVPLPAGLLSTGNVTADNDIRKFYEMRDQMLKARTSVQY